MGSGTPSSTASLGKFRVLLGWESPVWPLRSPVPLHSVGGGCPLPASFPVLLGAKREPTTPLLVKLAARPPCGLAATSSHTERCCRVLESAVWGTWGSSHAGGRSRSTATPSAPSLCPSGTHRGSAGCRGAEANLSPATAAAPCPQAPPSPPTSPALSNAAPATSSAPGRPVAPLATPPTSWCCGESGATSPWQPRAAHWDTGIFGDVPWVPPPSPCTQRASFFSPSYATSRTCWRYKAGAATTYTLPRHRVYVLTNTTAWVEARWGPHLHRSPNLTLNLNEAGKRREAGLGAPPRCRSPQPRCPRSEAGSSPRWDEFRQGQGAPAAPGAAAAVARQGAGAEQGGSLPRGGQPQLDAGKVLVARSRGGFAGV